MYLRHHVAHRLLRAVRDPCSLEHPASAVLGLLSRVLCTDSDPTSRQPLHFGVVGSGPAGFYTANQVPGAAYRCGCLLACCPLPALMLSMQLLKRFGEHARVDIIDRLPTPFGLVRSGVAPDHPETKVRRPKPLGIHLWATLLKCGMHSLPNEHQCHEAERGASCSLTWHASAERHQPVHKDRGGPPADLPGQRVRWQGRPAAAPAAALPCGAVPAQHAHGTAGSRLSAAWPHA